MKSGRPSPSAENVAAARAYLTRRGILDDIYAERFVRRTKLVALDRLGSLPALARGISWIAARTHFYDELITESLDKGVRQVVILAAGYDSRAWRLARDGVRFIEVDHPATQARKKALAPSGGPAYVAADLAVQSLPDVLASHVIPSEPVAILCEGLTYYLAEPQVRTLFSQAAEVAPQSSRFGTDFGTTIEALPLRGRFIFAFTHLWQRGSREPLRFELHPDDAADFLSGTGWSSAHVVTHGDLHARFLRGTGLPKPSWVGSYACEATK